MSYPFRHLVGMITRRHFARWFAGLALAPSIPLHAGSPYHPIAPLHPVESSDDPVTSTFLAAAQRRQDVSLYYLGGSSPGILRRFRPHSLYRLRPGGPIYMIGECQLRRSTRILRLDRVRLA